MGSGNGDPDGEYLDHDVELTHSFYLGEHEVTQDEWAAWTAAPDTNPSTFSGYTALPVETVSWTTVALYANALSAAEGLDPCYEPDASEVAAGYFADVYTCPGYPLPTEAEWEYAARAGEDTTYAGADTIGDVGWYASNSSDRTHNVCGLDTNAWGLCDMSGNVYEWVNDWHDDSYGGYGTGAASTDPTGPLSGSFPEVRGGTYQANESAARVATRGALVGSRTYFYVGFRLARSSLAP